MVGESQEAVGVGGGSGPSSNKMPTLEEYGTNLTTQATEARPRPRGSAPPAATRAPLPVVRVTTMGRTWKRGVHVLSLAGRRQGAPGSGACMCGCFQAA